MRYGLKVALVMATIVSTPARADAVVHVLLKDATDGGDVSGMEMIATPDHVKAGRVTIHASNQSHGLVHEVIVVRLPRNDAVLPYDDNAGMVIEKQIVHLGEVSDVPPGKSGSLTLRLPPGNYQLICNQPNHYKTGMWTKLTVTY